MDFFVFDILSFFSAFPLPFMHTSCYCHRSVSFETCSSFCLFSCMTIWHLVSGVTYDFLLGFFSFFCFSVYEMKAVPTCMKCPLIEVYDKSSFFLSSFPIWIWICMYVCIHIHTMLLLNRLLSFFLSSFLSFHLILHQPSETLQATQLTDWPFILVDGHFLLCNTCKSGYLPHPDSIAQNLDASSYLPPSS